jgi:hypothetical protein
VAFEVLGHVAHHHADSRDGLPKLAFGATKMTFSIIHLVGFGFIEAGREMPPGERVEL